MKIAHFCIYGPSQCGLYETAKELVMAEQRLGLDARLIVTEIKNDTITFPEPKDDNGFVTENVDWAYEADILVRHSIIPKYILASGKPVIWCLHGRPESSFMLDRYGILPAWTSLCAYSKEHYDAVVTFWPEFVDIFDMFFPKEKITCVPAPVNLDKFDIGGGLWTFKNPGTPNIILCDIWREDVTPFNVLMAARYYCRNYNPAAKIQLFGMNGINNTSSQLLVADLEKEGVLGEAHGLMKNIGDVYRAGDILVTPHVIATRVIREALACGCKVVAGTGCKYTPFTANPRDIESFARTISDAVEIERTWEENRQVAIDCFDSEKSARAMYDVFMCTMKDKQVYISDVFSTNKGRHVYSENTICEVHRKIYDRLLIKCDYETQKDIAPLLEEAYVMGIKMNKKLVDNKLESLDWEANDDDGSLRRERIRLEQIQADNERTLNDIGDGVESK